MRTLQPLLLLLLLAPATACRTKTHRTQRYDQGAEAAWSAPERAWEVVERGRVIGIVVAFQESGGERRFYSVRNAHHQELGLVDEHGRSWRYRAHESEPDWLGSGTIAEGVGRILGLTAGATLFEVPLSTLSRESS